MLPGIGVMVGQMGPVSFEYVGGVVSNGDSGTATVSLTGLTGGTGSAAQAGDLVLVITADDENSNQDFSISGYSEIADIYAGFSGTSDNPNVGAFRKTLSAADASFSKRSQYDYCIAYVFRGIDPVTPEDATRTTDTGEEADDADPAAITTVTPRAVVVAACHSVAAGGSSMSAPSGYTNGLEAGAEAGQERLFACFKIVETPGVEDPGSFRNIPGEITYAAITIALRPA